jgi:hypothetical protein
MMDPTDPSELTEISTSSSSEDAPTAPVHKVNIREVKQKTLGLLTELYKTETGDVRRMAMTLLQTLYTIEEEHQVQEMNGKIQKLMKLIEEQKREQAEMEEASLAASSHDDDIGVIHNNRSRAHTEESKESMDSIAETQTIDKSPTTFAIQENPILKRWQEKLGNMRKPDTEATEEITPNDHSNDDDDDLSNDSSQQQLQQQPQAIPQWRQSMTTKMDASRERWANGWKESTTKLQQGWNKKQVLVEAKPTEEESENSSVSTEGSSPPPSPTSLESTPQEKEEPKPDDLIKVFKNAFKDGIDSKQSRESLELAINVRKEKARHRWAETRAKWKWNNNNNNAATEAQA